MEALWQVATSMPTAAFSLLLALAVLYWGLVALGAFDIDLFSVDVDADADVDVDVDGDVGLHGHGILEFLSVGQVPLTLIVTVFVCLGWLLSIAAVTLGAVPLAVLPAGLAQALVLVLAVGAGLLATAAVCRRLRPLFAITTVEGGSSLVGRQVTVTSGHADERFGTASAAMDGPDLLLNVVTRAGVRLAKGEQAVVVEHDAATGVYLIAPLPHLRPGFLAEVDAPPAPPAAPVAAAAPPPALLADPAPAPVDTPPEQRLSTRRSIE